MISFYFVQLIIFARIHDVFHVNLLKLTFIHFLLNQMMDDEQFSEITMNNEKKYNIENIK